MHITHKTPPQGYCERISHLVGQADGRNSGSDVADTDAMSLKRPTVGARVLIKQPSIDLAKEQGIVARLDARGALVKLDSGREFLVEPSMIEVIA